MAFHAAVTVICDPGDEVLLPLPPYFKHVMAVQLAGTATPPEVLPATPSACRAHRAAPCCG
jgi:aspartate/methionine/tyrosine aminotransferase